MYPPILKVQKKKKRSAKDLSNDAYAMFCGFVFLIFFFILAYVDAIQMSTHNICFYKEVDKKYTGCYLKTAELLDCVLIGVCVVIRSKKECCTEVLLMSTHNICFHRELRKVLCRYPYLSEATTLFAKT